MLRVSLVFLMPALLGLVPFVSQAADTAIPFTTKKGSPLRWYDARNLTLEGRGWSEVKDHFDRLPAKAEGVVREPVWTLSLSSAGMCVRFIAETPSIDVHWILRKTQIGMPHMAPTGVSGVDLYGRTDDGKWRWIACGRPSDANNKTTLAKELPPGRREYRLYLPLYNGVSSVEIGLPESATIALSADPALKKKPVVFYGTSIMQGACASRPGMAQSSIIGRRLERPIINLGFSGNGKMEIEMARLLAELDPAAYVLDCLPNCDASETKARTEPLVLELRKARPNVPILLVEDRTYADAPWTPSRWDRNVSSRKAYRKVYEKLLADGVKGLTYVEGGQLLRDDGEDTVDGSHPTDLGFMRYADILTPIIEKALAD
jgi:hypothetical protein